MGVRLPSLCKKPIKTRAVVSVRARRDASDATMAYARATSALLDDGVETPTPASHRQPALLQMPNHLSGGRAAQWHELNPR